jgi:hypothetical protein
MSEYIEKIVCPKCKSTMIEYNKKGFGIGKALAGAIVTGGVGFLAGFIGSTNVKATCLACGKKFDPKEGYIKERINNPCNTITKFPSGEDNNKKHNDIVNMSDEEIDKKFRIWDNLFKKGLISENESGQRIPEKSRRSCGPWRLFSMKRWPRLALGSRSL